MPGPIVQASPGGTSPRTINNIHVSNHQHIERLRTVREERVQQESQDDHPHGDHCQDHQDDHKEGHQQQPGDLPDGQAAAVKEEENKAVTPACTDRMPGPIVQASPGGTCPRTDNSFKLSNNQPIGGKQEEDTQGHHHGDPQDHKADLAVWVQGSLEDDKQRYRDLMA